MGRPPGSRNKHKAIGEDTPAIGHNSGLTTDEKTKLANFVSEIERVDAEVRELTSERGTIYKSAKEQGFDTKALREVIRLRRLERSARDARENAKDAYMHALGMLADTPLGQAAVERYEATNRAINQ